MDRMAASCRVGHQRRSLETHRVEQGGQVIVADPSDP
jgi:hypothetical protein